MARRGGVEGLDFFTTTMAGMNRSIACVGVASYNMHGMNNGRSGLLQLCNNVNIHIIAVQEHWLHDSNIDLLNGVHPDFVGFCISSMSERLRTSVYYGRPYGGIGFLVRKTLSHRFKIGAKGATGRCLAGTLTLDSGKDVNIVTVYFPCYNDSISYSNELSECLSFLEDTLSNGLPSVILGDTNFLCDVNNEGFKHCYNVLSRYSVFHVMSSLIVMVTVSLTVIIV